MNVGDKDSEQPLTEGYYGERDAATGAWHGLGVRTFSDGRQYAGQWKHGAMNGLGRLQGPAREDEHTAAAAAAAAAAANDSEDEDDAPPRSAKGAAAARALEAARAAVPAGYRCCGEWRDGGLHGLGELFFARRSGGYVGEWADGVMHGHGARFASAGLESGAPGGGTTGGEPGPVLEPCVHERGRGPLVVVTLGDDKEEAQRAAAALPQLVARARRAARGAAKVGDAAVAAALAERAASEEAVTASLLSEEMRVMARERCRTKRRREAEEREAAVVAAALARCEANFAISDCAEGGGALGGVHVAAVRAGLSEEGALVGGHLAAAST